MDEHALGPDSPPDLLFAEIERLRAETRRQTSAGEREGLSRAILESATDYAIISFDLEGHVTSWNVGAERITGWSEAEVQGRLGHFLFTPGEAADGAPEREMRGALLTGRSEDERFHLRKDGSRFWGAGLMMPLRPGGGAPAGFLKIVRDRTLEHRAGRRLESDERRLRLQQAMLEAIFRSAPIGLAIAEAPSGRSLMMSDEMFRITGRDLSDGDLSRFASAGAVHPDGRPYELDDYAIVRSLRQGETIRRQLTTIERPDGGRTRVEASSSALRDSDGEIAAAVAVLVDVEERERAVERQQLLISELAHRMKNTLAMVQAIVSQTLRAAPSLHAARDQVMERFAVLARAQDILTQTNWDSATLDVVVRGALEPLVQGEGRIRSGGPAVRLGSRAALNFTLALHELATNALKYGSLSTAAGHVDVVWEIEPAATGPELVFTWNEVGGPPVQPPTRKGFGSRLLESLGRTFDARSELVCAPAGMCWRVRAELAALQPG